MNAMDTAALVLAQKLSQGVDQEHTDSENSWFPLSLNMVTAAEAAAAERTKEAATYQNMHGK